jgi:hypothetical protein
MSFTVRPTLSPDRRCLRLEFSHDVAQLVKLTKGTMVDLKTGKDVPIELPNIRKSSAKGTIEIHDGQPILLAVDYRPKDKVWLVLAEPRIYLEEEEEQLRKAAIKRMPMADEKPELPEPPVEEFKVPESLPVVEMPSTPAINKLLQAVVTRILTDANLKDPRDHYGTPGDKKFVLTPGDALVWPKRFRPDTPGFQLHVVEPTECPSFRPKVLGMRLEGYGRFAKNPKGWEIWMEVEIFNAGGTSNGVPIRSCPVFCQAKRDGDRWVVECWPRGQWEIVEVAPMK